MGFFELSVMGGGEDEGHPYHNFVVIATMIIEFGTGMMGTKICVITATMQI